MSILPLPIRRVHLDAIKAGTKSHEYRIASTHYAKRLSGRTHLVLIPGYFGVHHPEAATYPIRSITVVTAQPGGDAESIYGPGAQLYAIELGEEMSYAAAQAEARRIEACELPPLPPADGVASPRSQRDSLPRQVLDAGEPTRMASRRPRQTPSDRSKDT